jgi:hypothetical protein
MDKNIDQYKLLNSRFREVNIWKGDIGLDVQRLLGDFPNRLLGFVKPFLGDMLDPAYRLIRLSFGPEFIVTGKRSCGFLYPAFYDLS